MKLEDWQRNVNELQAEIMGMGSKPGFKYYVFLFFAIFTIIFYLFDWLLAARLFGMIGFFQLVSIIKSWFRKSKPSADPTKSP